MSKFSFVIPCYRSENTLPLVVNEIKSEMAKRPGDEYEIVFVNDYSPDNVWQVIQKLVAEDNNRIGINLARNFGQHAALLAGYARCTGDYVVSLDDDGQTPLDSLGELIAKIEEGYDVVYAYYRVIKQNAFRKFGTFMAKKMAEYMLHEPKNVRGSSFFIARKYIMDEIVKYKNSFPYLGGLILRTTRNIACVPTNHRKRLEGVSGYSPFKLLSLWVNGFTAFSVKPLELSAVLGFICALAGFIYAIVTIVRRIMGITQVEGWSTIISLLLIIGGMILIMLGLIGEYIGRIYISINNSPQYVVKDEIGGKFGE